MLCIREACLKTIPHRNISSSCNDFVIPGGNEYVRDKHTAARNAFLDWTGKPLRLRNDLYCVGWGVKPYSLTHCGKPRSGPSHNLMKTTRVHFKLALWYCKQHADMLRADTYANFF